jgi:Flp pilus assembly protein TadB
VTGLVIVLGMVVGASAFLAYRLLFPAPPPLQASLDRLQRRDEMVRTVDVRRAEGTEDVGLRLELALGRTLRNLGLSLQWLQPDLRLVGRSLDHHLGQKVVLAFFGLAFPQILNLILSLAGLGLGGPVPILASLALAVFFFFVPDLSVRSEARDKRSSFRHALSSFLDLVVISLAGGSGVESALRDSANIGHGWAYNELRNALEAAALAGETPWLSLARLGEALGVNELEELAASVSLAGTEGAKVRESLTVKADSLRKHALAAAEAEAQSATERMTLPLVMLFFGFLVLVGFPAVIAVLGT